MSITISKPSVKSLSSEELNSLLGKLPKGAKTIPLKHQKASLLWGAITGNRVFMWHDIGVGKTLISLYLNAFRGAKKTLVVCPNSVIESWGEQIDKHIPQPYHLLSGKTGGRRQTILFGDEGIFISSYNGLQYIFGHRIQLESNDGSKWEINKKTIKEAGFDSIIFDESHHLKNHKAIQTKVASELSKWAKFVICMTGTPISLGEEDLWSQYYVLDHGKTLGENKWGFLKQYFNSVKQYFGKKQITKWVIKPDSGRAILDRVTPITLRYSREECFDLPDKVFEERRCDMSEEQKQLIEDIVEGIKIKRREGELSQQDLLHVANKIAQVVGGLLILDGGKTTLLDKNPKLDLLMDTLNEVTGKVIIFHSFIEEGRAIEAKLKKAKIKYASLRGEIKDKQSEVVRFNDDGTCTILVAHPKSGGEGLNLQVASNIIFYSNGCYGAAVRQQSIGRIWRLGQERKCLIMDLIMRDSIDEKRLEKVQDRAELSNKILEYIEQWEA